MKETEYISVAEAAKLKNISRQAVYEAKNAGRLRSVSILGKIGLLKCDVEAYQPIFQKRRH